MQPDTCILCGNPVAPFILQGKRHCGDCWHTTGHCIELNINRIKELCKDDERSNDAETDRPTD